MAHSRVPTGGSSVRLMANRRLSGLLLSAWGHLATGTAGASVKESVRQVGSCRIADRPGRQLQLADELTQSHHLGVGRLRASVTFSGSGFPRPP
jgi:hypothetical protein